MLGFPRLENLIGVQERGRNHYSNEAKTPIARHPVQAIIVRARNSVSTEPFMPFAFSGPTRLSKTGSSIRRHILGASSPVIAPMIPNTR